MCVMMDHKNCLISALSSLIRNIEESYKSFIRKKLDDLDFLDTPPCSTCLIEDPLRRLTVLGGHSKTDEATESQVQQ